MTVAAEPGSPGSAPRLLPSSSELQDNNDPAWFKPRKALYEAEVLAPFRELIAAVGAALGQPGCRWSATRGAAFSASIATSASRPTSGSTRRMPGRY